LRLLGHRFAARCATINAMTSMIRTVPGHTPLVLDSPHSGTQYPDDFAHACDPLVLRRAEDTHVERLYEFAPALGVAWVEALFPRSYLDANRDVTEVDVDMLDGPWAGPVASDERVLSKVRLGKGLIWRMTDDGKPIYSRQLGVAEVAARIERCWVPYHGAVAQAIDAAHARHGYSIHINCHSMPAVASSHATEYPGLVHDDFVVGDRDGYHGPPGADAPYWRAPAWLWATASATTTRTRAWNWCAATRTRRTSATVCSWRSTGACIWTNRRWPFPAVLVRCKPACNRWWHCCWPQIRARSDGPR
jgi:N-formylglutamate amidohydrolase